MENAANSLNGTAAPLNKLIETLERTESGDKGSRPAIDAMKKGLADAGAQLTGADKIAFDKISSQLAGATSRESLADTLRRQKFEDTAMNRLSATIQSE